MKQLWDDESEEGFVVGAWYGVSGADNEMGRVSIEFVVFQSCNFWVVELDAERRSLAGKRRVCSVLDGDIRLLTHGATNGASSGNRLCPV